MKFNPARQIRLIVGIAAGFLLAPSGLWAQDCPKSPFLNSALWQPYREAGEISVGLSDRVLPEQPTAKWSIFDKTVGQAVDIKEVQYPPLDPDPKHPNEPRPALSAKITLIQPLAIDHVYFLFVDGLVFQHCKEPAKKLSPVAIATSRPKDATKNFMTSVAKGRDDSDFYFAPTIDGASGMKASYTLDTKFQLRKSLLAPQFGTKVAYHPAIYFIPGWDLKISSNPKEDGNSVNFLVPLEIVAPTSPNGFPIISRIVTAIVSQPGFAAEADKKFHDVNGVFADYEYLVLHGFGNSILWISPEPMIGVEAGSNLKAQSADTYPENILRADLGMHVGLNIFQPVARKKPLFSTEANYIRRLLLHPEPIFTTDTKGNYVLQSVGTQPREDVNVKISYNMTSYVALTAAYEYGELPPLYTKVDNKYTFGVTLQGQLQYRPGATK